LYIFFYFLRNWCRLRKKVEYWNNSIFTVSLKDIPTKRWRENIGNFFYAQRVIGTNLLSFPASVHTTKTFNHLLYSSIVTLLRKIIIYEYLWNCVTYLWPEGRTWRRAGRWPRPRSWVPPPRDGSLCTMSKFYSLPCSLVWRDLKWCRPCQDNVLSNYLQYI
jgi:hypothetical protein